MSVSSGPRGLGLWSATALVISHTIAVGIFLTPAQLIGALASPALTFGLWVACGALVVAGAFTFGELASRYPQAGGLYVYLREGWGARLAFLYGWQSLLIMDPGLTAALAVGAAQYVEVLSPATLGFESWVAVGIIWAVAFLNMAGLTFGARVFGLLTILKLCTLGGVIVVALTASAGSWSHFVPFFSIGPAGAGTARAAVPAMGEAIALGLVAVFFSFGGFWETSRIAAEVRDPRRMLPRALVLGVLSVTVIYIMTTVAFIYLVPPSATTSAPVFARRAGEALLGPAGPSVLAAIVVLSIVPSTMAMIMVAPRLYEAMSRDGLFPAAVAVRHAITGAPVRATMVLASLATVYVLIGTFDQIVAFFMCTTLGFVAFAAAALLVVRPRGPASPFLAPGYPLTPALFVLLVFAVVAMVVINRPLQAVAGLALVLLGVPVSRMLVPARAATPGAAIL
jgi:basic amino acid/polyamine antiporter, APA family